MRRAITSWRSLRPLLLVAAFALALAALACESSDGSGSSGGGGGDTVTDAGAQPGADVPAGTDTAPAPDAGAEIAPETVADATPEAVEDAGQEESAPEGCDPAPEPGSLWELAGLDRETGEEIPLCDYVGDVVLIVNTAAS